MNKAISINGTAMNAIKSHMVLLPFMGLAVDLHPFRTYIRGSEHCFHA
jgi:hypothetical protein